MAKLSYKRLLKYCITDKLQPNLGHRNSLIEWMDYSYAKH